MGFLKKALKVVAPVAGGIVAGPVGAFLGDQVAGGHYTDKLTNKVGSMMNNLSGSTDMLRQEMANNIQLWNMQNQYNTPSAQVARMAAAGINVNPMTYAVGNGNMSTTASNISAPSVGASGINPISTLMGVLSGVQGIKSQQLANKAQDLENQMTQKDLDFYTKHGYRPGQESLATLIPSIVDAIKGDKGNDDGKTGFLEWLFGKFGTLMPGMPKPVADGTYETAYNADDVWNKRFPDKPGQGPFKGRILKYRKKKK